MEILPQAERRGRGETLVQRLAALFRARPNEFLDARVLAGVAGGFAWRTRVSDLRRAPFHMTIENRQRKGVRPDGSKFVITEYVFRPGGPARAQGSTR